MPRVPVVNGPQVAVRPLNAPSLPPLQVAQEGENARRAAEALSAAAAAGLEIEQNKAIIRAGELEVEGQNGWLEEQARLTRERAGANAAGVGEEVDKYWNDFRARAMRDLTPMAASLADRALAQARLRSKAWALGFEQTELAKAAEEAFKASKKLAIDTESTDPAVLAEARDQIRQRNQQWAETKGLPSEWVQETTLADLTKLHTNVLTRLANDPINPERAQAYYLEHQDEISDPGGAIKATVDEAVGIGKAQQVGLDMALKFSPTQTAQAVRAIYARDDLSTKQKEIAAARLEHMHSLQTADAEAADRKRFEQAQLAYERDGVVPPALMAQLDAGSQAALIRQQKADARGGPARTDYGLYNDLALKLQDYAFDASTLDLNRYAGDIRKEDLDRLNAMKLARMQGATGEAATAEQQLSSYVDQLDVPSDAEEARQLKGAFRAHVHRQLQLFRSENGREPNLFEREEVIKRAMIRERDQWFHRERYAFEVLGDPQAEAEFLKNLSPEDVARLTSVPESDAAQIVQALRRRGLAVTVDNIMKVYRAANTKPEAP